MAGKCETITNSASAEAGVEAWAELGNTIRNHIIYELRTVLSLKIIKQFMKA